MRAAHFSLNLFSLALIVVFAGGAAHAAKFKVLHSFCSGGNNHPCGDGSNPQSGLVMDSAGNFYGTNTTAGTNFGTAFELERKPSGAFKFKTIYRFCSSGFCGQNPSGALILDTSGNLYGTADNVVFELSPQTDKKLWSERILYQFCSQSNCTDGSVAVGGLTYAGASGGATYDGVSPLYGVTAEGGANNGGTVFQLTFNSGNWTEKVLNSFCSQGGSNCTDGREPFGGVLVDSVGNLFGSTFEGGNEFQGVGAGVVYELSFGRNAWKETTLYRFCALGQCTDGALPMGTLVADAAGTIYGTTTSGGRACKSAPWGCGVVFKLVPNGNASQQTVIYTFCAKKDCQDGSVPQAGLVIDAVGNFLGTTVFGGGNDIDANGFGGGVAFRISNGSYEVLHRFCSLDNCTDGEYPLAPLATDQYEDIFGSASVGGEFGQMNTGGTVYKLVR